MEPLPTIDAARCNGCGRCVEQCPTNALALVQEKAVLAVPELCTYCTLCEEICPTEAIALPFLIVVARSSTPDA